MKKLLIMLVATFALSSCTDEYITNTELNRLIKDYVVNTSDWESVDINGDRYAFSFPFRDTQLDEFLYNNGTIVAYLETTEGGTKRQQTLPFVESKEVGARKYIRTIDFDYTSRGDIAFYVSHNDFIYDGAPETMRFRVVIIW